MDPISKKTQDAIDNLAKMNIAFNDQNLVHYSEAGNATVVQLLLEAGLKANATYYLVENNQKVYYWPLFIALKNNHFDIAKLLIQNGADINNRFGGFKECTPITYAIDENKSDVLKFLIENGVDVNKGMDDEEHIPIIHAINKNNFAIVEILVNNNCKLDFTCEISASKVTPLSYAIEEGHIEIAALLISKSAKVNLVSGDKGETPVFLAIRQNNIKIIELLINNKADVNIKRTDGYSPLMVAYQKRFEDIIQLLIKSGANPLSEAEINKTRFFNPNINPEIKQGIRKVLKSRIFKFSIFILIGVVSIILLVKACNSCSNTGSNDSSSSSSSSSSPSSSGSSSDDERTYTCPDCGGTGKRVNQVTGVYGKCNSCNGTGKMTKWEYEHSANK